MTGFAHSVAATGLLAFAAGTADAALLTFTNRAAFEAAVGSFTVTTFNAEATGTFTSRDVGPFTASEASANLLIGIAGGGPNLFTSAQNVTSPNGTNHLFFEANFTQDPLTLTFDAPISAFGFDFSATDSTQDGLDLVVQATLFNVSLIAPAGGFFGVIDTVGTFTTVALQDDPDGGGFNEGVGIDNVTFNAGAAVPEPATLVLWSLGALGCSLGACGRRRQSRTAIGNVPL